MMADIRSEEIDPVFCAYGHAVFSAGTLEHGMKTLIHIVNEFRKKENLPQVPLYIDGQYSKKTLGALFKDILNLEYVTEIEKELIWSAINDRNILVHSYWDGKCLQALNSSEGREWVVHDLIRRKDRCKTADKVIAAIIDQYLSIHGTSMSAFREMTWEHYENDEEPPDDVLPC